MTPEQRDDWSDGVEVDCDHCGERRPCIYSESAVDGEFRPGDGERSWWCKSCYHAAGMDI